MEISIVLPVHNTVKFPPECLDSLFAHTQPGIEIIAGAYHGYCGIDE